MYEHFEDMARNLSPNLRRIAHRMNGHFTFFSDDDLYQEALTHLWLLFAKGQLGDKTESYILQGCYFHLKNYLRKTLDKAKIVSLSAPSGEGEATLEDTIAGNDVADYSEIEAVLLSESDLLKRLDERERKILDLSMEGMTVREIGERLGVSHVMVVKMRARIKEKCEGLKNLIDSGYQD